MESEDLNDDSIDSKILSITKQFENEKERRLIQLVVEILVTSTLKECHEKGNQVFKVQ